MTEVPQPEREMTLEESNEAKGQLATWMELSSMMRELDSIKKQLGDLNKEGQEYGKRHLQRFAFDTAVRLREGQPFEEEDPQELIRQLQDVIRTAASEAERKIAAQRGVDYNPAN